MGIYRKTVAVFFKDGEKSPEFKYYMNAMYNLKDSVLRAWFVGLGNIMASKSDKNLVIDRHFASNYFWNGTKESDPIFQVLIKLFGKPDITFLLCASIETRIKRLQQRNPDDWDLIDPEQQVLMWDKMERFLQKFKIAYYKIDTNNKSEKQVIDIVIDRLKNYKFVLKTKNSLKHNFVHM